VNSTLSTLAHVAGDVDRAMRAMRRWKCFVGAALASALWTTGFPPPAWAQQPDTSAEEGALVTKEVEGLPGVRFKLPADWPIEVRGGVISPIPVEDYLARKFTAVNGRMKFLEERIQELEKRNQALEAVLQTLSKLLQELAPPTEEKPRAP
jgi:hypothetical protein